MKIDKFLVLIISLAILSSLFWSQGFFSLVPQSDGAYYNEVANNLLDGEGFTYKKDRAIVAPGYIFFIAGNYLLFGQNNYVAVRVIQIILFILSVYLIYRISLQLFNKKIALLSSSLMSVFYVFPLSASRFNREILVMFLSILLLYFLYQIYLKIKIRDFLITGLILGLLVLTNGITQLLFIPIVLLFFPVFKNKLPFKKTFLLVLIFLMPYLLVVGSWQLYIKSVSGSSSVTSRGGLLLYYKSNKIETIVDKNYLGHFIGHTFGYYFSEKIYPELDVGAYRENQYTQDRMEQLEKEGKNSIEINRILQEEAKEKILSQPHKYFLITVLNFLYLNSPVKPHGSPPINTDILRMFAGGRHSEIPEFVKIIILLVFRGAWYIFLIVLVYGLVKLFKCHWQKAIWLFLIILYFNLFYSAIHGIARYALPIYPFYIVLFSIGLFYLLNKFFKTKLINGL